MSAEPSEEQSDPRTVARFPRHLSGGIPEPGSPFDDGMRTLDPRSHGQPYDSAVDTYDRDRFKELP